LSEKADKSKGLRHGVARGGRGHPILFLSRGEMKNILKIVSFIKTKD
jgi:hypothetical protein